MKCHGMAVNLSKKKYEIISFWENHKHLNQKDTAQCFEILNSTLDLLKNETITESFENSSYNVDAKRRRKTTFTDVDVALLACDNK
jgi:hypothetical protein